MQLRTLRSVVANRPPVTAPSTATVVEAARLMAGRGVGAILVVDHGKLAGIFTERDALNRVLAGGRDPIHTTLSEVMTRDPQTLPPDEPFLRALRLMVQHGFRHLPVVEHGRPVGVVSSRDALDEDMVELRWDLEQREVERE